MKTLTIVPLLGCLVLVSDYAHGQCELCDLSQVPEGFEKVLFSPSNRHIVNPSRGFTEIFRGVASDFTPLTVTQLNQLREGSGLALAWRLYVLDSFVESDITDAFLNLVRNDMQVLREAKFTAVVRFTYTIELTDGAPYGDADKEWMLRHVSQLAPIFFENDDVIDVVQAGLIGTWGEWYYTTHFGDPDYLDWDDPNNIRGLTPENWQDRADVLNAMLDNVPDTLQVQVRAPQYKQVIHDDWTPTTQQEMEQRTHKARTGHYNDCFLANHDDMGTYVNKTYEYPYMQEDNLYTWMGGETCAISEDPPDRHLCPTALTEMSDLHFTFLNQDYNREVLDLWVEDGCFEEIHRDMGYRLQLTEAVFPSGSLEPGDKLCFRIELVNNGYASVYRPRTLAILLRNTDSGELFSADLRGYDTRLWLPALPVVVEDAVGIPDDVTPGNYEVLLALKHPGLQQYSDYNILLANDDVPHYREGLNSLYEIQITAGNSDHGQSCLQLEPSQEQETSVYDRLYCGFGDCEGEGEGGCTPYSIPNPSFETNDAWLGYGNGFAYTSQTASHGERSARVENGGVYQVWELPSGTRSVQVRGDSLPQDIIGPDSDDYAIYCDVQYDDDSWTYGHVERFRVDSPAWRTVTLTVHGEQDIKEVWCYGMFRNYGGGRAFFDNFHAWTSNEEMDDACV